MKKIFLIIIAVVMSCVAMDAAQLTPAQKKAKTEIFNALKKYGSNFKDEGTENIEFQYDGSKYKASVHVLNPKILYFAVSVVFELPEEYIPEVANIAANSAASPKPVCAFAGRGVLAFSCEMYAKDAKPFISVLPEMLNALSTSVNSFQDEYDKVLQIYVPSSHNGISAIDANDKVYIYPKIGSNTSDSRLYIAKVTLDPNFTILDMVSYNGAQYQNCTISENAYLMGSGKKYNLIKAEGITYSPIYTDYPGYESSREVSLKFRLYFPPLPKGTTVFDFMESAVDGWQIKGVELKHGNSYAISGDKIETAYHTWDCTAIEVQDGQTIVTKTVRPKIDETFMYSSQDEYIEDADTGRKYYLMNSSIGFEGSPEISYNTKEITFYEVYPSLPSNVKRINISSGSQYYVKDLKIR